MKRRFLKAISVILCIAMVCCAGSMAAFAAEKKTDCGDDCEFYPTIIIPGLGQSNTWVLDDDGEFVRDDEGNKVSSFPAYIQIPELIKRVIGPALLSLVTQRDMGLSDALADAIELCFGINTCDNDAKPSEKVFVEKYPYPFSECNEEEMAEINSHIPFNKYPTNLPEDHLYYFTYNSFGNHVDTTKELCEYIDMVKEQTGHDKVNIVPISQGGTFANSLFDYYPEYMDCLHKVIYIVPALDGSTIIGDVFNDRVTFLEADYLYNGFLEELGLLDANTARIIEVVARILPDEVLMACLEAAVERLVESVMTTSTGMWALCPSGDYLTAAEKYLSAPERASIKAQTYRYYQAQLNSDANIQKLLDKGVQVFNVCEYDFAMINVGETWDSQNADYIIHTDSTSMGAYFANVGETLPEDYVQKNTHCSNPEHNHISPDRVVDASAGLLPDTTFYFDGQRHDLTQHNSIILKLAFKLIADDEIKDVYSSPEFPQFNAGRDVRVIETLIEQAKSVDASSVSADEASKLSAAVAEAERVLEGNTCTAEEWENACMNLTAVLVELGVLEAEKAPSGFFEKLSLWLYDNYGTNGYSEMPLLTVKNIIGGVKNLITGAVA